jgi:hypothetical protein
MAGPQNLYPGRNSSTARCRPVQAGQTDFHHKPHRMPSSSPPAHRSTCPGHTSRKPPDPRSPERYPRHHKPGYNSPGKNDHNKQKTLSSPIITYLIFQVRRQLISEKREISNKIAEKNIQLTNKEIAAQIELLKYTKDKQAQEENSLKLAELKAKETQLITQRELENRLLLRRVMTQVGLRVCPTEWWHFSLMSISEAKRKLTLLK